MHNDIFLKAAFLFMLLQGCNTLYNTRTVEIEIKKPAKFVFSPGNKRIAIRYNNSNVSYNPLLAKYFINDKILTDSLNSDSTASEIYFRYFMEGLQIHHFFDSVIVVEKGELSGYGYKLPDEKMIRDHEPRMKDRFMVIKDNGPATLHDLHKLYPVSVINPSRIKTLDPEFGLYNPENITQIADSTGADLLLSLDYFASYDGITLLPEWQRGMITVQHMAQWNFFNLKTQRFLMNYNQLDTISWNSEGFTKQELMNNLPPRWDALMNAAELSGLNFAETLAPHWKKTERIYYRSGHLDLKKTDVLIKEGKWMEAAVIWKANVDNPNKKIAAKSMFNLAIACEMAGDLDAAIDWTVKSFYVFEQKNEVHAINCMEYLQILASRKQDVRKMEVQQNTQ